MIDSYSNCYRAATFIFTLHILRCTTYWRWYIDTTDTPHLYTLKVSK